MSYFLRVEGMNLGNFVYDTNDLATIRGGSLLLLEAVEDVSSLIDNKINQGTTKKILTPEEQIKELKNKLNVIKRNKDLTNAERKRELNEVRNQIKDIKNGSDENNDNTTAITKGASWGLFDLGEINFTEAKTIKKEVVELLNSDNRYCYATFMVDICKKKAGHYQIARDSLQTLNRWQQVQTPSFSVIREAKEICQIDRLSPANNTGYNKDSKKINISDSIIARRDYGREIKKQASFYIKRGAVDEGEKLELTKDLDVLSSNPPEHANNLKGKIAFIYIDGNSFGKTQKASQDEREQTRFDQQTRNGRDALLREIIQEIKEQDDWNLIKKKNKSLRLETLLWGGDEIIWVVPAWQGWWLLNRFYELAKENIKLEEKELFHGSSIIFCHHNAHIQRIDNLARLLADNYSKKQPFKEKDMIAYQVLESFDHVGSDLQKYREDRIKGLTENIDELLINANDMKMIENCLNALKENQFPRRKVYQIVQAYRNNDQEKAEKLYKKLIGGKHPNKEQRIYKEELQKLQQYFSLNHTNTEDSTQIHWLHLMELWDFTAITQSTEGE